MYWQAKIIINFSDLSSFPVSVIFIFKADATFSGWWPKLAYFSDFIKFFVFIRKKIKLIMALSRDFSE